MERATSVEGFMRFVNTFPGIRGEQAPLTPWGDDVAEFDQEKAGGGTSSPRIPGKVDRKSTRLNSSHMSISYAVFCLKKKKPKSVPTSLSMINRKLLVSVPNIISTPTIE